MKRSKFTETQIVAILKLAEQGMKVTDICREHGISNAVFVKVVVTVFCLKQLVASSSLFQGST